MEQSESVTGRCVNPSLSSHSKDRKDRLSEVFSVFG